MRKANVLWLWTAINWLVQLRSHSFGERTGGTKGKKYASLYHGGPFFDEIEGKYETVADYVFGGKRKCETKHAIVSSKFGRGTVLLSGVHFEVGPKEFGAILPFMAKNNDYLRCFKDIKNKESKRQKLLSDLIEKVRN